LCTPGLNYWRCREINHKKSNKYKGEASKAAIRTVRGTSVQSQSTDNRHGPQLFDIHPTYSKACGCLHAGTMRRDCLLKRTVTLLKASKHYTYDRLYVYALINQNA